MRIIPWSKGQLGKFSITPEGKFVHWRIDDYGSPHHAEIAQELGLGQPAIDGEIDPSGNAWSTLDWPGHDHEALWEQAQLPPGVRPYEGWLGAIKGQGAIIDPVRAAEDPRAILADFAVEQAGQIRQGQDSPWLFGRFSAEPNGVRIPGLEAFNDVVHLGSHSQDRQQQEVEQPQHQQHGAMRGVADAQGKGRDRVANWHWPHGSSLAGTRLAMAVDLYHTAPTSARESIQRQGLIGNEQAQTQSPWALGIGQPPGNYFFDNPEDANDYAYILQDQLDPDEQGRYPGDNPEQFLDHGVYDGTIQHYNEATDDYDEEPYDHTNPEHRAMLPAHLQGYDIWHVPPHAVEAERDPENVLMAQQNPHPGEEERDERGWLSPQEAEQMIGNDPYYYGQSPNRYLVRHPVSPEQLTLHRHIPAWGMTEEDSIDRMDEMGEREYPEPLHRTPIDWPSYQVPENKWLGAVKSSASHINRWSGLPCHCPWGRPKPFPGHLRRTAGDNLNRVLKAKDKALQSPEGQGFLSSLQGLPEAYDPLTPYFAQRWKKGELRAHPEQGLFMHRPDMADHNYEADPRWDDTSSAPRSYYWAGIPGPQSWQMLQWYNARQHPTRRGINVMDPNFSVHHMWNQTQQHQRALQEEQQLEESKRWGQTVHRFPNGWSIKHLTSQETDTPEVYNEPGEALSAEGKLMNHCIGNHNMPYQQLADQGRIEAYSLRDKQGRPHGTWHYNSDGSLAEMFGHSDSSIPADYMPMVQEWGVQSGHPWSPDDAVGNLEDAEEAYYGVNPATTVDEYYDYHHPDGNPYERAWQNAQDFGVNVGDDTQFEFNAPDIPSIADQFMRNGSDEDLSTLWDTARHNGDLPAFDREFEQIGLGDNDRAHWLALQGRPQESMLLDHGARDNAQYRAFHHPEHPGIEEYTENPFDDGEYNWDEHTRFEGPEPDFTSVASDLFSEPDRNIDEAFETAATHNPEHLAPLHQAMNSIEPENDEEQRSLDYWNNLYQRHSMRPGDQAQPWDPGTYQAPQNPWDTHGGTFSKAQGGHPNFITGEPCFCGFDWTKQARMARMAGKLDDFLKNPNHRPDLQTPEGQRWLGMLDRMHERVGEKFDPLTPWLTREWKKGRIHHSEDGTTGHMYVMNPFQYEAPVGELTGHNRMPLDARVLGHWADFYHSHDPERRGLGDIMQHDVHAYGGQVTNWTEAMRARAEQAEAERAAKGGEIVHTQPDNWTVRRLHTQPELTAEGEAMGHCVGGYGDQVESGNSLIYSLRDPKGAPHATWEISPTRRYGPPQPFDLERAMAMHPDLRYAPESLKEIIRQHLKVPNTSLGDYVPNREDWGVRPGVGNPENMHRLPGHDIDQLLNRLIHYDRDSTKEALPLGPEGGQVVQIQGKEDHTPIPEYRARIKNWFDSFAPEDKPQWGGDDSYESIYSPDDIEDRHLSPGTTDAYGLQRPRPDVSWSSLMENMVQSRGGQSYHEPEWAERAYALAVANGQIPEFAKAVERYQQDQQNDFDDLKDQNYSWFPPYPADDDEDSPAMQAYYDAESELMSEHPGMQAVNNLYTFLNPHWNGSAFENEIPTKPPAIFSSNQAWYDSETCPTPSKFTYSRPFSSLDTSISFGCV